MQNNTHDNNKKKFGHAQRRLFISLFICSFSRNGNILSKLKCTTTTAGKKTVFNDDVDDVEIINEIVDKIE